MNAMEVLALGFGVAFVAVIVAVIVVMNDDPENFDN